MGLFKKRCSRTVPPKRNWLSIFQLIRATPVNAQVINWSRVVIQDDYTICIPSSIKQARYDYVISRFFLIVNEVSYF
jgi:hypothetical protein